MIKVNVNKDVITITGHALYDDYGKDIVCAAVSSTVITTVNAILLIDKKAIKLTEKDGVKIEILHHTDIVDKLILNMINLLTELQSDYKDNINIRRC